MKLLYIVSAFTGLLKVIKNVSKLTFTVAVRGKLSSDILIWGNFLMSSSAL